MVGAPSLAQDVAKQDEAGSQPKAKHSGRLLVRMPATLHDELAEVAEREGVSLNQYITTVLAGSVEWTGDEHGQRARPWTRKAPARITWIALMVNLAVVLVAAIAAVTLLVIAWQEGW